MKRSLTILLAVLMLASVLCACANNTDGPSNDTTTNAATPGDNAATTTPPAEGAETTTDKYAIYDNLPELDYKDDTVTIISRGRSWCADEVSVSDINGETINDAIYNRNLNVESRLNLKINNIMTTGNDNYEITSKIRTQVTSGTNEYDLLANSVYATIMYTSENLFANLYDCEMLDLDQKYWAQGFNEAASIGNAQYFATGAACLSTYRFIFATFFNRNIFDENGIEYPFKAVNEGKWTLDYQYEISSNLYIDNGNGQRDQDDRYGFVTNADMIGVDAYWSSCKLPILTKTDDNWLQYSMDIERLADAVGKINHLIWDNEGAYAVKFISGDGDQEVISAMFANDQAAMVTLRLIEAEGANLRNMSSYYGIVPMPMLDETQDGYYSYAHDTLTAYAIPNNVIDDRRQEMGALLEALASESYRTVVPAYYEVTLKDKYCNDPESQQMLDLIIDSFFIDAGVLYTKQLDSIHQKMRTFIGSNLSNVASAMRTIDRVVPARLEKLLEGIRAVQERS